MKTKFLLLLTVIFAGYSSFSQESYPPTEIITGTYLGKTVRMDEFISPERSNDTNSIPTMVIDQLVTNPTGTLVPTTTNIPNLQTEPGQIASFP